MNMKLPPCDHDDCPPSECKRPCPLCCNWCRDGRPPITKHHHSCPHYNLEGESVALVTSLIKGIEAWAADGDGVHPELFDAYCRAVTFAGDLAKLKRILEKTET